MKMKIVTLSVIAAFPFLLSPANSYAKAPCTTGDCDCWIKEGGYCTAYIKLKTRKSQSGDANKWKSNIKSSDVKKGDVAIFKSITHVAYVENVSKDKKTVTVSEYNYGPKWTDKKCLVTDKFGVVSTRTVNISSVDGGFWRP